jgi:hypothetical protein
MLYQPPLSSPEIIIIASVAWQPHVGISAAKKDCRAVLALTMSMSRMNK